MKESLEEAKHDAGFLVDDLRAAHSAGGAVESLLLLPMIYRAADLLREINALISALEANE
jgi:hypothetical protein